jgi:hypothetical protein
VSSLSLDANSEARYLLPIFSHRGINELGVAVALVRSDLVANPVGQRYGLAWMLQFDFGQDQTGVLPSELVYLPAETVMHHLEPGLLDERTAAELEHLLGLFHGYLILELGSNNSFA